VEIETLAQTWSAETTTALSGRTADGSVLVFRPGRYLMKHVAADTYELAINGDSRVILSADEISHLRASRLLLIEGSWPAEP
jgi:hypothetical protein